MRIVHSSGRFHMRVPHGEAELLYRTDKNIMSIFHTFVPEEDRGRGLAEKLAFAAFEYAIGKRLRVRPDCPYIEHFLEKHPEMRAHSV